MAQHITSKDVEEYFKEQDFGNRRNQNTGCPISTFLNGMFTGMRIDSGRFPDKIVFQLDSLGNIFDEKTVEIGLDKTKKFIPVQKLTKTSEDIPVRKLIDMVDPVLKLEANAQILSAFNSWTEAIDESHENS